MQLVLDGPRCIGFLIPRGKLGVEAFDTAERSLGTFNNADEAAAAIKAAAGGAP